MTGSIIILSYPDTVVRHSKGELYQKVWPLIGVGGENKIKAGHAALVLISKQTKECLYYDFGRYITSFGNGRVRSKNTDAELVIPIEAEYEDNKLSNTEELLLWLEKHPEKTHGDDRLVAAVNNEIDYNKAKAFVDEMIKQKEIVYSAFTKEGSNCARFVTDTLAAGMDNKRQKYRLTHSGFFTPSPIGNVIKGNSTDKIYSVYNQEVQVYDNRSIIKEYLSCFLSKVDQSVDEKGTVLPPKENEVENATWLGGIGSGAWFQLDKQEESYLVKRYNYKGDLDFKGDFLLRESGFAIDLPYEFIYPSNCEQVFIRQGNEVYKFDFVK